MAIDVPDFLKLTQLAAPAFLGEMDIPAGQGSVNANFTVSPFATGLVVVPVQWGGTVIVQVSGFVSGYIYGTYVATNTQMPPIVIPLAGNSDDPIEVQVLNTSTAPGPGPQQAAFVYQLFGAGVQLVENTAVQPLYVRQVPAIPQVGAVQLASVSVSNNIAAGGTGNLIAGTVGQQIVVYGWQLDTFPVGAVVGGYQATLEDTPAAVAVCRVRNNVATNAGSNLVSRTADIPQGLPLSRDAGLKIVTNAGNVGNMFLEGIVYYVKLPYFI